jgi:hypothetical protein
MAALFARLRDYFSPPKRQLPPTTEDRLQGILGRLNSLERSMADVEATNELAVQREMRWQEMNGQLRRYLGRLDAHAGHEQRREVEQQLPGHLGPRADVIAAKYPNGVQPREE